MAFFDEIEPYIDTITEYIEKLLPVLSAYIGFLIPLFSGIGNFLKNAISLFVSVMPTTLAFYTTVALLIIIAGGILNVIWPEVRYSEDEEKAETDSDKNKSDPNIAVNDLPSELTPTPKGDDEK